ncbi:MAG: amidase [Reyranella sp.]|uniref:amidase n=2 Tax=Pseudomonadota TaxID=1224 RepID=UPI001AC4D189|nr:amidase [Reyranella sp.]MBN9088362.1 amidase [Reyranella sp.]
MSAPNTLTATEIARRIDSGKLTAEAVVRAHLERIDKRDSDVLAWTHLARDAALERARVLDRGPRQGLLHGVPMGVKDIIDSYDQPTGYGSPIYGTHQPLADAATVALAKHAGAILLGKTVTTEFANRHPGKTRNPHNPAHTPGGSSSGSAAAVADWQVVLATGTQTGGSVIRPAAFCGVYGYKPSFGHFPVAGMKANTEWLDTIGAYARSLEDLALFRAALMAIPHRPIEKVDLPRIAVCFTPHKDEMQPEGIAAIEEAATKLAKAGAKVTEFEMPREMFEMRDGQRLLSAFEGPRAAADEAHRFFDLLSKSFQEDKIAAGRKLDYAAWVEARKLGERGRAAVDATFTDIDAILTAPAPGEAPLGLERTGNATFNLLWTYLWMPCVTLPYGRGPQGLPVGIQLVGQQHEDARLLDIAGWVQGALR